MGVYAPPPDTTPVLAVDLRLTLGSSSSTAGATDLTVRDAGHRRTVTEGHGTVKSAILDLGGD